MSSEPLYFQAGGTLARNSVYVHRFADRELTDALLNREFCFILAPRQIGKSSLRLRTEDQLASVGVRCVSIDLTTIGGKNATVGEWYFGLIDEVARQLGNEDPAGFWRQNELLSPVQRWIQYLRQNVLARTQNPVVIFIDEIDAVLSQSAVSRDEFFAAARALYNARAENAIHRLLTLCLCGVATPNDLIQDESKTPFNIGRGIRLQDFSRSELEALRPCLLDVSSTPTVLLDEIFSWTNGHPYLSQKICQALEERGPVTDCKSEVSQVVHQLFFRKGRALEPNLGHTEQLFSRTDKTSRTAPMLRLYRRLLQGERIEAKVNDQIQMALCMTGMASQKEEDGGSILTVRNRIYATIFDLAWVGTKERDRQIAEPCFIWLGSGRQPDFLLRGEALQQALQWSEGREDITIDERTFLMEGLQQARAEAIENERHERLVAEAQVNRRNVRILLMLLLVLFTAFGTALWQFWLAKTARIQAEEANMEQRGLRATLLANQPGHAIQALLLGLYAVAPYWRQQRIPPAPAVDGLAAAVATATIVPTAPLRGHRDRVMAAAFSPDGRRALTGSLDARALVWDVQSRAAVLSLEGHSGGVLAVAYSRDGQLVVTGSADKTARIWNALTGRMLLTLTGHKLRVSAVAFSPDGQCVATASEDAAVRLWDSHSGRLIRQLNGHASWITSVTFSPDGSKLLTASHDTTARLWEVGSGRLLKRFEHRTNRVFGAAFSQDGRLIATVVDDEIAAHVWDAETSERLFSLHGHGAIVTAVAFSSDNQHLATGSADNTTRIWNLEHRRTVATLEGHGSWIRSVTFAPDGQSILTASDDATARLWDLHAARGVPVFYGTASPNTANYSAHGDLIVTSQTDGTVQLRRGDTGKLLRQWRAHESSVLDAVFSKDGSRIATSSTDRTAALWDSATGALLSRLNGHTERIDKLRFSPDGKRIVTASSDKTARIWDVQTGALLQTLLGHDNRLFDAAWSPDGHRVVTGSEDRTARVWDADTGKQLLVLRGHQGFVLAVGYSPDGRRIVTGSADNKAMEWDAARGGMLQILGGHSSRVFSASFSPDGTAILTASADHQSILWDVKSSRKIFELSTHNNVVKSGVFSPNGDWIITAGADGTVRIFPSSVSRLFTYACELLTASSGILDTLSAVDARFVSENCPASSTRVTHHVEL